MFFDPLYFLILAPAMLFAGWAQMSVKGAYERGSRLAARSGLTGAEVASSILQANGIQNVGIEMTNQHLGDHYDPKAKMLRLSPDVYRGRSLAALGIAAHEVGHAIQDKVNYGPLVVRNGIVPLASVGSNVSFIVFGLGLFLGATSLVLVGVGLFSLVVFFQLVNLPVEFDASNRARSILLSRGIISRDEEKEVGKVLNAAALTYVAATVSAILTLLYFLLRSGLLGGRRD